MFSGTHKEYQIAEHTQAEMRAEAEQARLLQTASAESNGSDRERVSRFHLNRTTKGVLVVLTILVLLIAGQQAFAQMPHPVHLDPGNDPGGDPIKAYREGRYYLRHGEYELAVEKFTEAIEGLPEVLFQMPGYADMYWFLGEAQEGAGMYREALVSYQTFLDLVGELAAPWTFEKVEALSRQVNAIMVTDLQA
jgi:cytochrome c-type biogenesis protein CcmH/NrfG